ncbi:helix-turn-helix transcriptional regulator [Phytohabitans sp. ZYX-F-186]|uniref:Helix-turn-helix transcriptional regulator n=1 Tax=Phytohabitans maris TaxID=3071409 RepID=A0ABU0ZN60_9ACTN|nr:helix-turn-helix transcriptional regulator [Phytohabitans sp. ZYX-F-186]MDQ7907372.1 helix-turn-helix transcriptional regulator [Phytohabitans sp. ZYX-F-186]
MILLRRVIGDALRARRQGQHRTLREVSTAANVSLGYLSEIERGQKEASSELLASICEALGAQLSELLREVSDEMALAEQMEHVLVPAQGGDRDGRDTPPAAAPATRPAPTPAPVPATAGAGDETPSQPEAAVHHVARPSKVAGGKITDGAVSVSIRQDTPLSAVLRTTRTVRPTPRDRDVVCVA